MAKPVTRTLDFSSPMLKEMKAEHRERDARRAQERYVRSIQARINTARQVRTSATIALVIAAVLCVLGTGALVIYASAYSQPGLWWCAGPLAIGGGIVAHHMIPSRRTSIKTIAADQAALERQ